MPHHPGNLLRTADGKLCILDFGLMTEVEMERRLALVEYIAHLSVQDWQGVARDLVNLGFTPEGMCWLWAYGYFCIILLFSANCNQQAVEGKLMPLFMLVFAFPHSEIYLANY